MNRIEIEKKLRKELDRERFTHTQGVMYTAGALAMVHDVDLEQAILAGLLHDCAKCIPNHIKLELCQKWNIVITPIESENPFLLHAKLGACLAKKAYAIEDDEILHAISTHTTGSPQMNTLDKIIYIADYIEPNRCYAPNLTLFRKMAFCDLDKTMTGILADTLSYLKKKSGMIDPMTEDAYNSFCQLSQSQPLV